MNTSRLENETRSSLGFSCSLLERFLKDSSGKMETVYTINCVINGVFSCSAILANTLIMVTILRRSYLRSPSLILLVGLSVSDLGVGLLAQPLYVFYKIADLLESRNLCCVAGIAFVFTSNQLAGVSILTMALLCVDRYLALYLHLRYNELVTPNRVKIAIMGTWILSAFANISWFLSLKAYYVIGSIGFSLFLIATSFAFTNIFLTVRRHRRKIKKQAIAVVYLNSSPQDDTAAIQDIKTSDQTASKEKQSDAAAYRKSAKNMFLIYFVFVICVLPFTCALLISTIMGRNTAVETAFNFTMTLVFVNSTINPFLFCILMRDLRREVRITLIIVSRYLKRA